jgi:hypothetical protein
MAHGPPPVLDDDVAVLVVIDPVDEVPVTVEVLPLAFEEVAEAPPTPLPPLLTVLPPDPIEAPAPVAPVELPVEHPMENSDAPSTAETHKRFIVSSFQNLGGG